MPQIFKKKFITNSAIFSFAILIGLIACQNSTYEYQPKLTSAITSHDIRAHLKYLDSKSHSDNIPGGPQEAKTADYIADELESFGLLPAGDDSTYFQEYSIQSGVKNGEKGSYLVFNKHRYTNTGHQVLPYPNSSKGSIESMVAWVGYGLHNKRYDEYKNLDVNGKIVLMLDGKPGFSSATDVSIPKKIQTAEKLGAVAVLIVRDQDGKNISGFIPLSSYNQSAPTTKIPVLQISKSLAGDILKTTGLNLNQIENKILSIRKPQSRQIPIRVNVTIDLAKNESMTRNIVALLPGTNSHKRYIVVSGFYNHEIKNHDTMNDAVTTAGLLELAQYLGTHPIQQNVLFTFFSGGNNLLNGAGYFSDNPTIGELKISALVALQPASRMENKFKIITSGATNFWKKLVHISNTDSLKFQLRSNDSTVIGTSFARINIPVITFDIPPLSGKENNDISLLRHISRMIANLDTTNTQNLVSSDKTIKESPQKIPFPKLTLGLLPDYGYKGIGLRIRQVDHDRPAQIAGLKKGDIIISLAGDTIRNIMDYMKALDQLKSGEHTTIGIHRNGEKMTLSLQL